MTITELQIRTAVASDAAAFLDLWNALDTETEFMLFEPGERQATLDDQKSKLAANEESDNVHLLVLDDTKNQLIAGFCAGRRNPNFRDNHSLHIVIGIRQHYTNQGWGRRLLTELEQWARSANMTRLELSVMEHNSSAIALYSALGFVKEGTKRKAVRLRSGFVDEHIMAKLIG